VSIFRASSLVTAIQSEPNRKIDRVHILWQQQEKADHWLYKAASDGQTEVTMWEIVILLNFFLTAM